MDRIGHCLSSTWLTSITGLVADSGASTNIPSIQGKEEKERVRKARICPKPATSTGTFPCLLPVGSSNLGRASAQVGSARGRGRCEGRARERGTSCRMGILPSNESWLVLAIFSVSAIKHYQWQFYFFPTSGKEYRRLYRNKSLCQHISII